MRFEHYVDSYPDQSFTPERPCRAGQLAGRRQSGRARALPGAHRAGRVAATRGGAAPSTSSPRAGFAYDLTGDNRTVLKGYYGRFYFNSADTLANRENPVGSAPLRYQFLDLNGNRLLDGPQELGRVPLDAGRRRPSKSTTTSSGPYSQELSTHLEREIIERSVGPRLLRLQERARRVGRDRSDAARGDDDSVHVHRHRRRQRRRHRRRSELNLLDRPAATPQTRLFTNPTDPGFDSDFQTVEFAVNRRFAGRWMLLTSFGYTWLDQFHDTVTGTGALDALSQATDLQLAAEPATVRRRRQGDLDAVELQDHRPLHDARGRSASRDRGRCRAAGSGAATSSITFPGDGAQTVRVEEVTANRAPTVQHPRLPRRQELHASAGSASVTGMVDVFNALNSGTVHQLLHRHGRHLQARHRHSRSAHRPLRRALRLLASGRWPVASFRSPESVTGHRSPVTGHW